MEHATAPAATTGHTKQYVFVDEYNRHKRLKVMRACDGCRKRKIRCDGALQNGPWPCGACLRLKLKCVPPTLDPDDEHQQSHDSTSQQATFSFHNTTIPPQTPRQNSLSHPPPPPPPQDWSTSYAASLPSSAAQSNTAVVYDPHAFTHSLRTDLGTSYSDSSQEPFASTSASTSTSLPYHQDEHPPNLLRSQTELSEASSGASGDPAEVDAAVVEMSCALGDLKIDITSAAQYMSNEKRNLADAPAVEEVDVVLPPSVSIDSTVRIPPEMMPSDDRVMDYFGYFFDYVHPYIPVLKKRALYNQWRTARHSISPLLLEGLFACVARYLEDPIEIRKWLALAARHEESFKDVPRLSTIQAMILLMKAREFVPKRGYYYRSWMSVKYMTTMAIELGLNEHTDSHRAGITCKLSREDCMVRTRTWQVLFCLESFVGASQGRSDFLVELETVDVEVPSTTTDVDTFEQQTSRRWTHLVQLVALIKQTNMMWQATKNLKKDWALDPKFVRHNESLVVWYENIPSDLQMHFPEDSSAPWLGGDHFRAFLHIHYHLVVMAHHRPQLQTLLELRDPDFKKHLDILTHSAFQMCRIQEALYRDFGMHGLSFMSRGTNYTIYCVLTCTMLHLAAITSPDPMLNSSARSYFTRHMRILEYCLPQASTDMQEQINALREAFSQDITKPFELKPSLGLRSPSMETKTPPGMASEPHSVSAHDAHTQSWTNGSHASSATISPSTDSGRSYDYVTSQHGMAYHTPNYDVPTSSAFAPQGLNEVSHPYALHPVSSHESAAVQPPVWDPSGIFNSWNTAFGGAPPPPAPQQAQQASMPNLQLPTPTSAVSQHSPTDQNSLYGSSSLPHSNNVHPEPPPAVAVNPMPMVTPVMWQDAFTNAYVSGHGTKRYREDPVDSSSYMQYGAKRRA